MQFESAHDLVFEFTSLLVCAIALRFGWQGDAMRFDFGM
jgi:hypothetical protein